MDNNPIDPNNQAPEVIPDDKWGDAGETHLHSDTAATPLVFDPAAKTLSLSLTLTREHGLKTGDRVRLHMDGKRVDLNVNAVPSARDFVVANCEKAPEKVLVYGKQVNDFRIVDYDRIFTTSVGAVQDLARKLETQEAEYTELREANAALAQKLAALEAKDKAREAKIAAIEKRLASPDQPAIRTVSLNAATAH